MRCRCEADETQVGPKMSAVRNGISRVSRVITHYRKRDQARFWHWEDQAWDLIKPGEEYAE